MFGRRLWRRSRLTGVSVSVSGPSLSWEFSDSERTRARDILHRLEDHRVLYAPYVVEEFELALDSVERLRTYLTEQVELCDSTELRNQVRALRAAVRQFMTDAEAAYRLAERVADRESTRDHVYQLFLTQALGVLRGRVGVAIGEIGKAFRIPIDGDLAHIMPPDLVRSESNDPLSSMYFEDGYDSPHLDPPGPEGERRAT
jgi:hypothetical protein